MRVADPLVAIFVMVLALVMPHVYGNELLLFNFVLYLTLAQGLILLYGFTGFLPFGYVGFLERGRMDLRWR